MRTASSRFSLIALVSAFCTTVPALAQTKATVTPVKRTTIAQRSPVSAPVASTMALQPTTKNAAPAQAVAVKTPPNAAPVRGGTMQTHPAANRSAPLSPSSRQKYLNLGVGVAAYYGGGLPLGASFEVDVKNNISVGGSVDYLRYGHNYGGYKWNYTFVYAGARASYHLGGLLNVESTKFDPYVGATLGLRYAGYGDNSGYDNYVSPYSSGLFMGVHLGSRYLFNEKIGGFAEVGYGVSALRLGLTTKF